MTAGSGIVHDEFHSESFTKKGGIFEMVQLWVNLPKKYKMTTPKYQSIEKKNIPIIKLTNQLEMRLIAGDFKKKKGPANTFTKIKIMDFFGKNKSEASISLEESTNTIILILNGNIKIQGKTYSDKSVIIFSKNGTSLKFKTSKNFKALLLNGEPIDEPIVSHGPFVMNTEKEIEKAFSDYENGLMGKLL